MMTLGFASMIPAGFVLAGWGLWASGRADSGWLRWVGAAAAPTGVFVAALGTLLVVLPEFFTK